jgi:hypothetical protein
VVVVVVENVNVAVAVHHVGVLGVVAVLRILVFRMHGNY